MTRSTVHHPGTEQLLHYLDGEVSWLRRRALNRHMAQCGSCSAQIEEIRCTEEAVQACCDPHETPPGAPSESWRAQMRADLTARLYASGQEGPSTLRAAWLVPGRLAFVVLLVAFAALAAVVGILKTNKPLVPREFAPVPAVAPSEAVPTPAPAPRAPRVTTAAPNAGSLEVAALVALHGIGADLGDPVSVSSDAKGGITVVSADVGPDRELALRAALAAVPGLTFRLEPLAPARTPSGAVSLSPQRAPLTDQLEAALGAAALQSVANAAVDEDELLMAAAHALHNLDLRFPPVREAALNERDRAALRQVRADLTESFREHARKLLARIEPVRRALAAKAEPGRSGLFEAAGRMDKAVLRVFAGASCNLSPSQLAVELESAAAQVSTAAGELR